MQPSVSYYVTLFSPQVKFKQTAVEPQALFPYLGSRFIWSDAISHYLLLPKALRGRTAPRQNHEVGETCVHPPPFCSDNLTLDSLSTSLSPSAYSRCSLFWIYPLFSRGLIPFLFVQSFFDCIIFSFKKMFSGSPRRARQARCSLFSCGVLFPTVPLQCATVDGSPTSPFLFTHLFPCCSFCLSRPSPLISIHGKSNHHSGLHSAVSPPSAFPNCSQPLSSTPHP